MKKKAATSKRAVLVKGKHDDLAALVAEVRNLIQSGRHAAASTVNILQVLTNFEIGRRIVEHEQKGEKRAGYGAELLKQLSAYWEIGQLGDFPEGFWEIGGFQDFPEGFWEIGRLGEFPEGFWEIGDLLEGSAKISIYSELVPLRRAPLDQGPRRTRLL
jgi:hypothetical protein